MKNMEVVLYKLTVFVGKEEVAKEWLAFLEANKEKAAELLVNEKAYYEAYFTTVENNIMYVYMTFASDNVEFSNKSAWKSKNELDKKHFKYMKDCIDIKNSVTIPATLQFNTFE